MNAVKNCTVALSILLGLTLTGAQARAASDSDYLKGYDSKSKADDERIRIVILMFLASVGIVACGMRRSQQTSKATPDTPPQPGTKTETRLVIYSDGKVVATATTENLELDSNSGCPSLPGNFLIALAQRPHVSS